MTTIAATLRCMAADRRLTGDVISNVPKLFRVKESIVGCAGDEETILIVSRWIQAGMNERKKPALPDGEFEAMILAHTGIWVMGKSLIPYQLLDKFHAIGSGAMAAKAVMHIGHHPQVAVQVASHIDESTGPEVDVFELRKRKR